MSDAMVDILKAALKKIHASQHLKIFLFSYGLYIVCWQN